MAAVYWIRAPHHTDLLTEGYIGVTLEPKNRFRQHRSAAKRGSELPVHRAIRKYATIHYQVLVIAEIAYCYELEAQLRPCAGVGYNSAPGGEVSPTTGTCHTKGALQKQREAKLGANNPNFGKKISNEQGAKISAANSGERHFTFGLKNYQNPRSNKQLWADADWLHTLFISAGGCGMRRLATLCGRYTADNLEIITKSFKAGWVPAEDADWLSFAATVKEAHG